MSATLPSHAAREPGEGRRWATATALALLIELLVLAALAWWSSRPAPPPPPQPVEITLTQPKPPPKVVTPKPPPPKPKPKVLPKPKPRVVHHVVHHPPPPAPPKPRIQPPPTPAPATRPTMPVAPPPPPPPPRKPPKADVAALRMSFEALLREAVQDAVHYPESARLMQVEGRTLVGFTFIDGRVSQVHVVKSSGVPSLDSAALRAVRTAPYPQPPAALAGHALSFVIWVRFHLSNN